MAASILGKPELANVFYYGKEFGSKKQKLTKKGTVKEEKYRPLSVTQPGAELPQLLEQVDSREEKAENESPEGVEAARGGYLSDLLRYQDPPTTVEELLEIIRKG